MRADENTKDLDGYRDEKIEQCLDMLIDLLDEHINRGIFVFSKMKQEGDFEFDKYRCASLMLLHAGISLVGIKKFYRPITLQSKDVIVIFRPIFEGILNCLYVLSSGPDVAHRALKHAAQKPYRRAGEEFQVGSFRIALSMNSEIPDQIRGFMTEFTSSKGRELNWTSESINTRLDAIGKKYGEPAQLSLATAYIGFYGHSSEYVHASLFSILEYLTKESKEAFYQKMVELIFTCVVEAGMCVLSLLDALESETGITQFKKASQSLAGVLKAACETMGAK